MKHLRGTDVFKKGVPVLQFVVYIILTDSNHQEVFPKQYTVIKLTSVLNFYEQNFIKIRGPNLDSNLPLIEV